MYNKLQKALLLASSLLIFFCTNEPIGPTAGDGTQIGNAKAYGYIYNEDGTPAKGTKVVFVASSHNPYASAKVLADADTLVTDSRGYYGTNSLSADTFNVFAEDTAGNLSYEDSIIYTGDTTEVPSDTLKPFGSVKGFIKLQAGGDPEKIIVIVMGSNKFSLVGSASNFALNSLAEGTYHVKFFSTLDNYSNLDTTFNIKAGKSLSFPDSIELPLRIPKVTGLKISYDNLKQIVTLNWDKADTAKIKGYNVYRQHIDSTDVKLNVQVLADTVYADSTGVQDETYIYSVVGVDLNSDEGLGVSGDSVKVEACVDLIYLNNSVVMDVYTEIYSVDDSIFYAVNTYGNSIDIYDSNLNILINISDSLDLPENIITDKDGNIYISEQKTNIIKKFNSRGEYVLQWSVPSWVYYIKQLRIDKNQNIVSLVQGNPFPKHLITYSNTGEHIKTLDLAIIESEYKNHDFDFGFDSTFVFQNSNHIIKNYDLNHNLVNEWDVGYYIKNIVASPIIGNVAILRKIEDDNNLLELYNFKGELIWKLFYPNMNYIFFSTNGSIYFKTTKMVRIQLK